MSRHAVHLLLLLALSAAEAVGAVDHFTITTAGGTTALGNQTAGVAFAVRITAYSSSDNSTIDTSFTGTVTIDSNGGTGDVRTGGLTTSFTAGVLDNHQVVLGIQGAGRHLIATSGGVSDQSATFNVANDQPVVALDAGQLDYIGDSGEQRISPNATVSDIASLYGDHFAGGQLTIAVSGGQASEDVLLISAISPISVQSGSVRWNGTAIGTYTGGLSGSSLVVTLNSSAEPERVAALVQHIAFLNLAGPAPTTGIRTVSFTLSDGDGGSSAVVTRLVNVQLGNSAPVLAVNNGLTVPRTATLGITTSSLSATDVDLPPATSLRFTLKTFPLHGRIFRRVGTVETTLSATGTTTFTQDDLANNRIFYEHLGDLATSDSVVLFVADAANAAAPDAVFSVAITGTSADPALTLTDPGAGGLVVLEGAAALRISPAAVAPTSPTVSDGDSQHYRGATLEAQFLTASNGDDGLVGDVISVLPQGGTPGLSLSGSTITCTPSVGVPFTLGTIDSTLNGQDGRKLLIRLADVVGSSGSQVVTTDALALLLANLAYACISDTPVTRTRRLVLTLRERSPNPGVGSAEVAVRIDAVNDAPVFSVPTGGPLTLNALSGVPVVARVVALDNDLPPGASLAYLFAAPSPAGSGTLTADAGTGAFSFIPAVGYTGAVSFTVTAQDDQGATSGVATVNLGVLSGPTGTPPVVISDPPLEIQENEGLFQVMKLDLRGATPGSLGASLVGNPPPGTDFDISPDSLTVILTCPAVPLPADGCWCFGLRLTAGGTVGYAPITLSVRALGGSN